MGDGEIKTCDPGALPMFDSETLYSENPDAALQSTKEQADTGLAEVFDRFDIARQASIQELICLDGDRTAVAVGPGFTLFKESYQRNSRALVQADQTVNAPVERAGIVLENEEQKSTLSHASAGMIQRELREIERDAQKFVTDETSKAFIKGVEGAIFGAFIQVMMDQPLKDVASSIAFLRERAIEHKMWESLKTDPDAVKCLRDAGYKIPELWDNKVQWILKRMGVILGIALYELYAYVDSKMEGPPGKLGEDVEEEGNSPSSSEPTPDNVGSGAPSDDFSNLGGPDLPAPELKDVLPAVGTSMDATETQTKKIELLDYQATEWQKILDAILIGDAAEAESLFLAYRAYAKATCETWNADESHLLKLNYEEFQGTKMEGLIVALKGKSAFDLWAMQHPQQALATLVIVSELISNVANSEWAMDSANTVIRGKDWQVTAGLRETEITEAAQKKKVSLLEQFNTCETHPLVEQEKAAREVEEALAAEEAEKAKAGAADPAAQPVPAPIAGADPASPAPVLAGGAALAILPTPPTLAELYAAQPYRFSLKMNWDALSPSPSAARVAVGATAGRGGIGNLGMPAPSRPLVENFSFYKLTPRQLHFRQVTGMSSPSGGGTATGAAASEPAPKSSGGVGLAGAAILIAGPPVAHAVVSLGESQEVISPETAQTAHEVVDTGTTAAAAAIIVPAAIKSPFPTAANLAAFDYLYGPFRKIIVDEKHPVYMQLGEEIAAAGGTVLTVAALQRVLGAGRANPYLLAFSILQPIDLDRAADLYNAGEIEDAFRSQYAEMPEVIEAFELQCDWFEKNFTPSPYESYETFMTKLQGPEGLETFLNEPAVKLMFNDLGMRNYFIMKYIDGYVGPTLRGSGDNPNRDMGKIEAALKPVRFLMFSREAGTFYETLNDTFGSDLALRYETRFKENLKTIQEFVDKPENNDFLNAYGADLVGTYLTPWLMRTGYYDSGLSTFSVSGASRAVARAFTGEEELARLEELKSAYGDKVSMLAYTLTHPEADDYWRETYDRMESRADPEALALTDQRLRSDVESGRKTEVQAMMERSEIILDGALIPPPPPPPPAPDYMRATPGQLEDYKKRADTVYDAMTPDYVEFTGAWDETFFTEFPAALKAKCDAITPDKLSGASEEEKIARATYVKFYLLDRFYSDLKTYVEKLKSSYAYQALYADFSSDDEMYVNILLIELEDGFSEFQDNPTPSSLESLFGSLSKLCAELS